MNPVILGLSSLATTALSIIWLANSHSKSKRARMIAAALEKWVPIIFDQVNNLVITGNTKAYGDNKTGLFMDRLSHVMGSLGFTVTPEIAKQALAMADALHYQEHRGAMVVTKLANRPN